MDEEGARQFEEGASGKHIRARLGEEIRRLDKEIDTARSRLEEADLGGEEETALILRLAAEKAQKEGDLEAVAKVDDPPLTDPHILGWEATQGLVEYELVAGKDTLVRVFVEVREIVFPSDAAGFALPNSFHFTGADEWVSRLDYASLEVKAPNGSRFRVPATMSGKFGSRSMSAEDNVNFYIAGDQLSRTGSYTFVARFYRRGELVGTNTLGTRKFLETGDLRLLIKVNTWPMSDAGWDTVLMALQYLQRNLPVRAGVAPMDSDVSAGLRYFIDPRPYDPGFSSKPSWANAKLALNFFNFTQNPLESGDRAHMLMNVLSNSLGRLTCPAPLKARLAAARDGSVECRSARTLPGANFFASVIGQEIGHNLIPLGSHTLDPVIETASAFDLLNRRTVPQARTIMFATVAGATSANDICFTSSTIGARCVTTSWF